MQRTYPYIWVKAAPSSDPALAGREVVRKPWNPDQQFTSVPERVEKTPSVIRMLQMGDIVEVPESERKE